MTDLEYPPQTHRKAYVRLVNKANIVMKKGRMEIWEGEPNGSWVAFKGFPHYKEVRIALRREGHDWIGTLPDTDEDG